MREYRINLLPKSYTKEKKIDKWMTWASIIMVLEVIIFIVVVIVPSKLELRQSIEKLDQVSRGWEDDSLIEVNQILNNLEEVQEEVKEWQERYERVQKNQWISKSLLESVTERVPLGVGVNKVILPIEQTEDKGEYTIRIEGNSEHMTSLLNYITVLEQVFGVEAVSFETQYKEEIDLYEYGIDIEMAIDSKLDEENIGGEE